MVKPRLVTGGRQPREPHLTADEKAVLDLLAEAWSSYIMLPGQDQKDRHRFSILIEDCRRIIAFRVARMADPEVWTVEDSAW